MMESSETKENHVLDLNPILHYIGALGRWQAFQSFCLIWLGALAGIGAVAFAITGFVPKHRCYIPECEPTNATYNNSTIFTNLSQLFNQTLLSCHRPKLESLANKSCHVQGIPKEELEWMECPRENLIFDKSVVQSSITQDYLMVCNDRHINAIFSSLFNFGRLLGAFFIGFISDHFGRMKAITLSTFLLGIHSTLLHTFLNCLPHC